MTAFNAVFQHSRYGDEFRALINHSRHSDDEEDETPQEAMAMTSSATTTSGSNTTTINHSPSADTTTAAAKKRCIVILHTGEIKEAMLTWRDIKKLIGGRPTFDSIITHDTFSLTMNDDGLALGLPVNRLVTAAINSPSTFVGNAVLGFMDDDGQRVDVPANIKTANWATALKTADERRTDMDAMLRFFGSWGQPEHRAYLCPGMLSQPASRARTPL